MAGAHGSMRAEGGACAACSHPQGGGRGELMRVAIGLLSAGRRGLMRVTIGLLSAGRRGLMRVAIGLLSAGRRELMRVAIGLPSAAAGGQGADGQQPEHAARPMCMRM